MMFSTFYSAVTAFLIAVLMVQRVVWITIPNDFTHSIGFGLTVVLFGWFAVSVFAIGWFKRQGLAWGLPVGWLCYQVLIIASGLLRPDVQTNATLYWLHMAFLFVTDGFFVYMYAKLAKRLLAESKN